MVPLPPSPTLVTTRQSQTTSIGLLFEQVRDYLEDITEMRTGSFQKFSAQSHVEADLEGMHFPQLKDV